MTECERIIRNGILPESYFREEMMCDFFVNALRKRIWAVELDLLLAFDKICKKHHLRYYLIGGTLLGAVRHRGFIPWDDDIDVIMPRKDYDELQLYHAEFKEPYFFQTPETDPGYFFAHPRLRNSNTTAIQRPFCDCRYNMGIFIDILPLDSITKDQEGESLFQRLTTLLIDSSTTMKAACRCLNQRDQERVRNLSPMDPLERYRTIHSLGRSMMDKDTPYCFPSTGVVYGFERSLYEWSSFSDAVEASFEGYPVPIPVGYERILQGVFGNYMVFPPLENRGTWHGTVWFDTERSYLEVKQDPLYQEWAVSLY